MKVYVDELPTVECPCNYDGVCTLLEYSYDCNICYNEGKRDDCPLKLLKDHDKQVRKEVCKEIYNKIVDIIEDGDSIKRRDLMYILDQIQGENNGKETKN